MSEQAQILRTPDKRFVGLPGYPWQPRYHTVKSPGLGEMRMHYVDEGPRAAPVVLMLHGEPTWSFLYRRVIDRVLAAGYRAVAPDHIGFGRSDKPAERSVYTYDRFVEWLNGFVTALDLRQITLVCQDWGGPIGLRVLAANSERFDAVVAANTLLPNCEPPPLGIDTWPGGMIEDWAKAAVDLEDMPIGETVESVSVQPLAEKVRTAYDAPFPGPAYKAGALAFPCLIPIRENSPGTAENRRTWAFLETFDKPFVTAFSDSDPSTRAWASVFRERIPGSRGQPHTEIAGAGHFLQEDQGEALGKSVIELLARQYEPR